MVGRSKEGDFKPPYATALPPSAATFTSSRTDQHKGRRRQRRISKREVSFSNGNSWGSSFYG